MNPERTYHETGQLRSEEWRNDAGVPHRLDGPAFQVWHENGQLWWQVWWVNGLRHRLDGPARRGWYDDGRLGSNSWYVNGVEYKTEAEFQVAVDLYKATEIAELF